MLDKSIITLSEKNNKFLKYNNMKFLGLPLPLLLRCHDPSLEISTTRGYTLIPRTLMTNIRVFAIDVDMRMNVSQRQHPIAFYHVNRANSHTTTTTTTNNNNTMGDNIHIATHSGNLNRVRNMISEKKELVWCKDAQGNLALHLALEKGYKEVAKYLIGEFPQGSYALNYFEKSPLYLGVENGHKDLVEFMLKNLGKDKEATKRLRETKLSILFPAITTNNQEMVQVIVKYQPKLMKTTNKEGWSPLTCATYDGLTDIISVLLEKSPDDIVLKDSSNPILMACKRGHVHILKMFYSYSPKGFTKPDENGLTILHHAAKEPNNRLKEVVSYLLSIQEGKKLVKLKDENGRTPSKLAERCKNNEVVELFRRNMSP